MHPRIKDLKQAAMGEAQLPNANGSLYKVLDADKFAELIIQECAYVARQCYTVRAIDAEDVATHIEEYFTGKK